MKIRNGYVSNSSSSSFVITNKTDKELNIFNIISEMVLDEFKDFFKVELNEKHINEYDDPIINELKKFKLKPYDYEVELSLTDETENIMELNIISLFRNIVPCYTTLKFDSFDISRKL